MKGLEAGATLARSYRLLHTIGEGGMGRVWVAEQIALDRKVAIKVLSDEAIQSTAALELFHREARATAKVDSPHVIRVLDFDVTDHGCPFLVLELLIGETLEERVQRVGALPLDDVREMIEQTCNALTAAHGCGILHRDIKAENLFLQHGKRVDVKLLDFGIALYKTASDRPSPLGPVGTPQYMSPEQMLSSDVDERADLFSLGVCAYYALTTQFPFPGDTVAAISCALSTGTFVPPSALRSGLPPALDTWFLRALAVRPDERFSSPREMLEAFTRATEPQTRRDTPVGVEIDYAEMQAGWPRAVWKTIGAIAALACILVAVHAGIVERRAARLVSENTQTTAATIAAARATAAIPPEAASTIRTDIPPPPEASTIDAGPLRVTPAPQKPHHKLTFHHETVIAGTEGFGSRE